MINDLTTIRPLLSNTYQEIFDYIDSYADLGFLRLMNETKEILSSLYFNQTKELIKRNSHYLNIIVTDQSELVKQRKTEGELTRTLERLYDLMPRLIQKNHTHGIEIIGQHIDVDSRLLGILHRNLTFNVHQVDSLIERANAAVEEYSNEIKLH